MAQNMISRLKNGKSSTLALKILKKLMIYVESVKCIRAVATSISWQLVNQPSIHG